MKAFWIDAGEHSVCVEFWEELGGRYEDEWFGGIVYAETAAKAKHAFIKEFPGEFEYTDKMSIRVLATSTGQEWKPGYADFDDPTEEGESPWMLGKRSKYGEERYQEFKGWQKELAGQ